MKPPETPSNSSGPSSKTGPVLCDTLTFHPLAWIHYQWFCHRGPTEVAAFAVTSDPLRPLYITHMCFLKQTAYTAFVELDDAAVHDHLNDWLDRDLQPYQINRIWCHTHPGVSPHPSAQDWDTFSRLCGQMDWAVMMILAKGGACHCTLRTASKVTTTTTGPFNTTSTTTERVTSDKNLHVAVDWTAFRGKSAIKTTSWERTYQANVVMPPPAVRPPCPDKGTLILTSPNKTWNLEQRPATPPTPLGRARRKVIPGDNLVPPPMVHARDLPISETDLAFDRELATVLRAVLPLDCGIARFCGQNETIQRSILRDCGVIIKES